MTFAAYIQPAHYNRSDGARVCAHNVPVGPGACAECHSLTDEHWEQRCTCDLDAFDAAVAAPDDRAQQSMLPVQAQVGEG